MSGAEWSARFASAPRASMSVYEDVMVPRMFTPWAQVLLDEVALEPGDAVLDVACGPGSVTRLAAARVGTRGHLTGCDLSGAMLAIAAAKPPDPAAAPIDYVETPADRLPLPDAGFDAALCQQGLQFFPDRPAALAEMRRVLRPGGRVAIAVWSDIGQSPPFAALGAAIRDVAGDELADRFRGGPWGLSSAEELGALLERAGFLQPRVGQRALPVVFEGGPSQLATVLQVAGVAAELDALSRDDKERLERAIAERIRPLTEDGAVRSHLTAHLAVARR